MADTYRIFFNCIPIWSTGVFEYGILGLPVMDVFVKLRREYAMWIRRILQSQAMVLNSSKSWDMVYLSRMIRRIDVSSWLVVAAMVGCGGGWGWWFAAEVMVMGGLMVATVISGAGGSVGEGGGGD
ncbi:hypothetical protein Tco_1027611 [Tanacetum coccineum]